MVELIVMKYSKLSQIAAARYLSAEHRHYHSITIIECRVYIVCHTACEFLSEQRIEIYFCRVSLTIGYIAFGNIFGIIP